MGDYAEKELEQGSAPPSFMNIAKVDSINYFSGKSSSHARKQQNQQQYSGNNQSMESAQSRNNEQRMQPNRRASRPIFTSNIPQVEQSRLTEANNGGRQAGLKRLYLDMNPRGHSQIEGDLSQIKEVSQTMNDEVGSVDEFAVSAPISAKR